MFTDPPLHTPLASTTGNRSPWGCWLSLWQTLVGGAMDRVQPPSLRNTMRAELSTLVGPCTRSDMSAAMTEVLVRYFSDVPSHQQAVMQLDVSLFTNDIPVPTVAPPPVSVPLGAILGRFSQLGSVVFGTVWLSVLDLAEACNPTGINVTEARAFIHRSMQQAEQQNNQPHSGGSPPHSAVFDLPNQAQMDGLMQSIMGAFPAIGEQVAQLSASSDAEMGNNILDSLQNSLLKPMLDTLSANPAMGNVGPCVTQILDGFKNLNRALNAATVAPAAENTVPSVDSGVMMIENTASSAPTAPQ